MFGINIARNLLGRYVRSQSAQQPCQCPAGLESALPVTPFTILTRDPRRLTAVDENGDIYGDEYDRLYNGRTTHPKKVPRLPWNHNDYGALYNRRNDPGYDHLWHKIYGYSR